MLTVFKRRRLVVRVAVIVMIMSVTVTLQNGRQKTDSSHKEQHLAAASESPAGSRHVCTGSVRVCGGAAPEVNIDTCKASSACADPNENHSSLSVVYFTIEAILIKTSLHLNKTGVVRDESVALKVDPPFFAFSLFLFCVTFLFSLFLLFKSVNLLFLLLNSFFYYILFFFKIIKRLSSL